MGMPCMLEVDARRRRLCNYHYDTMEGVAAKATMQMQLQMACRCTHL